MEEVKQSILDLLEKIEKCEIDPDKTHLIWAEMNKYRDAYVKKHRQQSWNTFIGHVFQKMVFAVLKCYFRGLRSKNTEFQNLDVMSESEVRKNEIIAKKLSISYGEGKYFMLPDTDMAIVDYNFSDPWNSEILGIISCKTSLRERVAQACYWKLKLKRSKTAHNVRAFLATADNDKDFSIGEKTRIKKEYDGMSRDRVIAEYELDGVYILRGDFKEEWESSKVKRYDKIFNDLIGIFRKIHRNG